MPELAPIKLGCHLKLLRATIAADNGNANAAIREAQSVHHVAAQIREESVDIAQMVALALDSMALHSLEIWASCYPEHKAEYLAEALRLIQSFPEPNLKLMHRADLSMWLKAFEDSQTEAGRKSFGFKQGDIGDGQRLVSRLIPFDKARVDFVTAERDYWRGLNGTGKKRDDICAEAKLHAAEAVLTSPELNTAYWAMENHDSPSTTVKRFAIRKLLYKMVYQAICGPSIPKIWPGVPPISPADDKPVRYSFDGKTLKLNAGRIVEEQNETVCIIPYVQSKLASKL